MRTTVVIDDDILRVARTQAKTTGRTIGRVLSELARRGLVADRLTQDESLPVFRVSEAAPVFGPEEVARGEDEL
jgi:hypothetical protein